jgi:hypothetical protein
MTSLALPALDGRTPLGFLAALGVLRLVTAGPQPDARLCWSKDDCTAILHDAYDSLDALVADLAAVVETIPDGGVLPGLPADFPPLGAAPDKLRLPRTALREYAEKLWRQAGEDGERWLASLVTDLSLDDKSRVDITPLAAPSGKQSMRTMLEKPLALVREQPQVLREAVAGWRRYSGVTGEYLDHRVLFDAADAPDGKSLERGVPGATWLALMSYPLFRTTIENGEPITTGWHRTRRSAARLIYPLWSEPLDPHGIAALLRHPVLRDAEPGPPPDPARVLSVFWVCCAERQRIPGRTFAGVLTPVPATRRTRALPGNRRRQPGNRGQGRTR